MKMICWNVRGLRNPRATRRLRHMLKVYNPQTVFFMETKLNVMRIEKMRRRCGFLSSIDVSTEGTRWGICLAWKRNFMMTLRNISKKQVDVEVQEDEES